MLSSDELLTQKMEDPFGLLAHCREADIAQRPSSPVVSGAEGWERPSATHNREVRAYMSRVCARHKILFDAPQFDHMSRMAADMSWFTVDHVNYPAFIVNLVQVVNWPAETIEAELQAARPHLPHTKAAKNKADGAFKCWANAAGLPGAHQITSGNGLGPPQRSGR